MNTWQVNLVIYFICYICFFQSLKISVKNSKKDGAMTVLLQLLTSFLLIFLLPFFPWKLPNISQFLLLIVACVFYALYDRLQTTTRKHLQVSMAAIIQQLTFVFITIYGVTFFKETVTLLKVLGAVLIIVGNITAVYRKGHFALNKYVWLAILASFTFATGISIDVGISDSFNLAFYIILILFFPALLLISVERISFKEIHAEYKAANHKAVWLTAISWGLTIIFSLRTFMLMDVTTVGPLQSLTVVLNVLFAYFIFNEKDNGWQKLLAAVMAVIGIYLISLA